MEGTVLFHLRERHYGFISLSDDRGQEVASYFFQDGSVIGDLPVKGDVVSFWLDRDVRRGNLIAVGVEVKQ
jgi:hypothetical protein